MDPLKFEIIENYLITTRAPVMAVSLVDFFRAPGPGIEQRIKSRLPSIYRATHNCSGLHPPLQPRGKGMVFSNSPNFLQVVYSKTASEVWQHILKIHGVTL